ncbi:MAG: hypothetical protein WA749_04445 [Gelidibacter sp.]
MSCLKTWKSYFFKIPNFNMRCIKSNGSTNIRLIAFHDTFTVPKCIITFFKSCGLLRPLGSGEAFSKLHPVMGVTLSILDGHYYKF